MLHVVVAAPTLSLRLCPPVHWSRPLMSVLYPVSSLAVDRVQIYSFDECHAKCLQEFNDDITFC